MASAVYNNAKEELAKGGIDFSTGTFKILLTTTTYTPNVDTHAFRSDISGEASGTGYTAGGNTLASLVVTQDDTNDRATVDAADITFSSITVADVDGAVIYEDNGSAATDVLIAYIDFTEGAQTISDGDFTITFDAAGFLTIT